MAQFEPAWSVNGYRFWLSFSSSIFCVLGWERTKMASIFLPLQLAWKGLGEGREECYWLEVLLSLQEGPPFGVSPASGGAAKATGEAARERTVRSPVASPLIFAVPPLARETPRARVSEDKPSLDCINQRNERRLNFNLLDKTQYIKTIVCVYMSFN